MDSGAWWAAVFGVAQSRTRLKRLSSSSPVFPEPFIEEAVFAPMHILASFLKNKVCGFIFISGLSILFL